MPASSFRFTLLVGGLIGLLHLVGTLVVYAFDLHSSRESLEAGQLFESIFSFVSIMACLALGLRSARNNRHRAGEFFTFGYGARLGLGTAAAAGLFTALGRYAYVEFINPDYLEHLRMMRIATLNLPPETAAQSATAAVYATGQGFLTTLFSLMIAIAYAFLFRDRPAPVAQT